jgi:triacylglycerol lipase
MLIQVTPIVLHHGLFQGNVGIGSVKRATFKGIDKALIAAGFPVFVSSVHPTAGVEKRARQLKQWLLSIRSQHDSQKVILIAHSLGGLDARYMLTKLDMDKYVQTLVTVSTPHRGSPFADWCVENFAKKLNCFSLVRRLGWDIEAFEDLTTERCARFNEKIRNVPGVSYYSISASRPRSQMPAIAVHPWTIVRKAEGPNDGLVSVQSAKWGKHLGTWRVDHWQTINRHYGLAARRDGDISPRYVALLKSLHSA